MTGNIWGLDSLNKVLEKHRSGMSNSQIGEVYGVSGEWIRQLVKRAKERESAYLARKSSIAPVHTWEAEFCDLTIRIGMVLSAAGLTTMAAIKKKHAAGELKLVPNLGTKGRIRVEQWLSENSKHQNSEPTA